MKSIVKQSWEGEIEQKTFLRFYISLITAPKALCCLGELKPVEDQAASRSSIRLSTDLAENTRPRPWSGSIGTRHRISGSGPAEIWNGQGIAVQPQPQMGLGTVADLDRGDVHHRDNTGAAPVVRSGARK